MPVARVLLDAGDLPVQPERGRAPFGGGFKGGEFHGRISYTEVYDRTQNRGNSRRRHRPRSDARRRARDGSRRREARHFLPVEGIRLELRLVQGARQDVPGRRAADPARPRGGVFRRRRQPGDRARPHLRLGPADQLPALVRPVRQPAAGAPVRGPAQPAGGTQARRHRLLRDPREHRGRVRQRRRPHVRGHAAGSGDAAVGVQPQGRRPHHEVRLRAGEDAQEARHLAAPSPTASRSPCPTGTSASPR